jgi:predicted ATPase
MDMPKRVYDPLVITRFYVHNFRCLENFELPISRKSSVLLIGKNGAGKTTTRFALEILQKIARGVNRVRDLLEPKDLARGRTDVPVRFELEVRLQNRTYEYSIAFELPEGFKELRVRDEKLAVDGVTVYSREHAQVHLAKIESQTEASFRIDWHVVALPIVEHQSTNAFKQWLASILILGPIPSLITGDSPSLRTEDPEEETLWPNPRVTNFGAWFSGILSGKPYLYTRIDDYLRQVMPDLQSITRENVGKDSKRIDLHFATDQGSVSLPFEDLSDGEKCFMICALVLAANEAYGPMVCFWDEPDSHLALSEVGHFVLALRKGFQSREGQFIATSHNPEAIRRFSDENTLLLYRNSHLEPTIVRPLSEIQVSGGDLVGALIRDDLTPVQSHGR